MATVPVKSPLHNFPPRLVKWAPPKTSVNNNNNQRFQSTIDDDSLTVEDNRRLVLPDCRIPPPTTTSPSLDLEEGEITAVPTKNHVVGSRSSYNTNNNNHTDKSPVQMQSKNESDDSIVKVTETSVVFEFPAAAAKENSRCEVVEPKLQKQWNLRPRRMTSMTVKGGLVETTGRNGEVEDHRYLEGTLEKKRKMWIALSKEEIEEDIYSLTGIRPSRRPQKRPRNVQKQLDKLYPGMWLVGVSPETYQRGLEAVYQRNK